MTIPFQQELVDSQVTVVLEEHAIPVSIAMLPHRNMAVVNVRLYVGLLEVSLSHWLASVRDTVPPSENSDLAWLAVRKVQSSSQVQLPNLCRYQ